MDYNYLILQRELDEKIKNKNRNESLFSSIKNLPKYNTEISNLTPFNYRDNISSNASYQQSLNNISQKQSSHHQLSISSNYFDVVADNNSFRRSSSPKNENLSPLVKNGNLIMNFAKDTSKMPHLNENKFPINSHENNSININNKYHNPVYDSNLINKNINADNFNGYKLKYHKNNNEFLRSIDVNKRNVLMNFLRPIKKK